MYRTNKVLDEVSLNRIYQHVVDKKVPSWGIITAYRNGNSKKKNIEKNNELAAKLREMGYGFAKMKGAWKECQDQSVPYSKCPPEKLVDAHEITYFVPNLKKDQLHKLCNEFEQDAVIYGDETTKGNAHLMFQDGSSENIGKFHPDTIAANYTKLNNNRNFTFAKRKQKQKVEPTTATVQKPEKTTLKSLLPTGVLNSMIKNPETGRNVKVKSALRYDKDSQAYKAAKQKISNAIKK